MSSTNNRRVILAGERGALVKKNTSQTFTAVVAALVTFEAETYDTDSIHDNATNNSRLTVPSGITKVRLSSNIIWANGVGGVRRFEMLKNGASFEGSPKQTHAPSGDSNDYNQLHSPILNVIGGDYFEVQAFQNTAGNLNVLSNDRTWFAMELIK